MEQQRLPFLLPASPLEITRIRDCFLSALAPPYLQLNLTEKSSLKRRVANSIEVEYDGRYLRRIFPDSLGTDKPLSIKGGLGGTQVNATMGGVFGLNEVDGGDNEGKLFSNGGFQLDIVGQYPLRRSLFLRFRMSFASNDPLTVTNQTSDSTGMPPDDQLLPRVAASVAG